MGPSDGSICPSWSYLNTSCPGNFSFLKLLPVFLFDYFSFSQWFLIVGIIVTAEAVRCGTNVHGVRHRVFVPQSPRHFPWNAKVWYLNLLVPTISLRV